MNMLAHRHLPPTPQDAAIARVSGQALSRYAATRGPLKLRVTDAEQMEPIELPAGARPGAGEDGAGLKGDGRNRKGHTDFFRSKERFLQITKT